MYGVCGCCGALRPRYKRLVDNIFPEDPEDGLVKTNMEKLTFYALSAPEKLDRIGAYLSERLIRDVGRHRYGYVCIAMEALDQLLMACHCQSINLFVESFLKMVAKLLESEKPNLQILGTNSFVKFANIEEDTPSYHRSYDFFVSRFSEMCHSGHEDLEIKTKIRMSGIKGLQGVVRKTVNDELQANIWDPQHMDKIVPSLLFNLQHVEEAESESKAASLGALALAFYQPAVPLKVCIPEGETVMVLGSLGRSPSPLQAPEKEKENPAELAERCLRELLGRAAFGNIKNAIKPVLVHLDNHSLWEPKVFAIRCFKIIMYSIQPQHSHLVIQQLLSHLDANSRSAATVRAGIVEVLSEAAVIAATGSVGPTVLEMFNTLLRQLRLSIDYALTGSYDGAISLGTKIIKEHEERMFQEAVIKTIGSFASTLPTYQRSEVILFIMSKVPLPSLHHPMEMGRTGENRNRLTQIMLLKSLLQVSTGFQCNNMMSALPSNFLDRLLSTALMEDAEIRLFVLEILISFIDRHGNRHKFSTISTLSDISVLKLKVDKCSRQDTIFMKKHSQQLYRHIYLSCKEETNIQKHYEALYGLLALISIELANEEVVVDLIRLVLAVQDVAQVNEENLPVYNRCALYALGAAYLNLISQLTTVPAFCQHIREVIESRKKEAPYMLPEDVFVERPRLSQNVDGVVIELLFRQSNISEVLGGSGYNADRLCLPYIPQLTDEDRLSKRKSIGETISLQVEVESRNSPEKEERVPAEEITYETLKKAIVDSVAVEEQERERRRQVVEKFQKAPFEEIAAHCGARASLLQSKLNQIFEITIRPPPSPSGTITAAYGQPQSHSIPVYEMKFPDLCVY
ncbi:protein EFR3 homolog B isoform X3 [Orcinus orca]|uniref:protein EFR3 homolog B isoform X3 n=3 Tax=Delphinidae TaxID=9726 RepID=UPI002113632F|nr:protein EFR3 homolog B isoform X3 [Orcinus orca]XP_059882976.1 protein EFR3 homolog B isoform X1 [Delphinus delphis]XP_060165066.1 protein EFR3 homolog B isoform X4 [Globicephala melas]